MLMKRHPGHALAKGALLLSGMLLFNFAALAQAVISSAPKLPTTYLSDGLGTKSWSSPDAVTATDDSYATLTNLTKNTWSDRLVLAGFNFQLPATAVVAGIEVTVERRADNTLLKEDVRLLKSTGPTIAQSDIGWPVGTDGIATYGSGTDLWQATWTPDQINDPSFGVDIRVMADNNGTSFFIDHVTITIHYSVLPPPGTVTPGAGGYDNISGTFTIGGADPDFPTVQDAMAFLDKKRMVGDVGFYVRDGSYQGPMHIDATLDLIEQTPELALWFISENTDAPNVIISGTGTVINVFRQINIGFWGLTIESDADADAIAIDRSAQVVLRAMSVTNTGTGNQAVTLTKTNNISIDGLTVSANKKGVKVTGGGDGLSLVGCHIETNRVTVNVRNQANVTIGSNELTSTAANAPNAVTLTACSGSVIVEANTIAGGVTCDDFQNIPVSIADNELTTTTGTGFTLTSCTGTLSIAGNTLTASADGIVIDNALVTAPPAAGYSIEVRQNTIEAQRGILLTSPNLADVSVLNNRITNSGKGIAIISVTNSLAGQQLTVVNNVAATQEEALVVTNVNYSATDIRSNTLVVEGATKRTLTLFDTDNLTICSNNVVNEQGLEAVFFGGTLPTTISATNNNFYSAGAANTNQVGLLSDPSNFNTDPVFSDIGDYRLSYRSTLIALSIPCLDFVNEFDIDGNPRMDFSDLGAIESPESAFDGLNIEFVLVEGYGFTPGSVDYPDFRINGLDNYVSVNMAIFNRAGSQVFASTNPTEFWTGVDVGTGELAGEGAYRYELTLNGRLVQGFVYVMPH